MAKKRVKLSSKQFFTIAVLSSTLLVMLFLTTGIIKQPTKTTSDAAGWSQSLDRCTSLSYGTHLMYAGGVKLFNGDNFTGGDRVMCVRYPRSAETWSVEKDCSLQIKDTDYKKGSCDNYFEPDIDIYGEFQLKAESLRIRALGGCKVNVSLYAEYGLPDNSFLARYSIDRRGKSTHNASIEIPEKYDNLAKSLKLSVICDDSIYY